MHCTIRFAEVADAADVARIRAEASSAPGAAHDDFSADTARHAGFIGAFPQQVLLAHVDGVAAGFMALRRDAHAAVAAGNPLQLWQLYVSPSFHGSGVAAQLMAAGIKHARGQSRDVIWLGVSEGNARAIAFYRKHGFRSVGVHGVGEIGHAHRDLVMMRSIA